VKRIAGLKEVVEIAANGAHTCARHKDGGVTCWGAGRRPARVAGVQHAIGLALGRAHACALLEGERVVCWGDNGAGQLGDGTTRSRPVPAPIAPLDVRALAAGGDRTCALTRGQGPPWCWGDGAAARAPFR